MSGGSKSSTVDEREPTANVDTVKLMEYEELLIFEFDRPDPTHLSHQAAFPRLFLAEHATSLLFITCLRF